MAVSRMRSKKIRNITLIIYLILQEQFGRCGLAMGQILRSTERIASISKKCAQNQTVESSRVIPATRKRPTTKDASRQMTMTMIYLFI